MRRTSLGENSRPHRKTFVAHTYSVQIASGGFRVGGPEARLKRRPSDDVIIFSQPW